MDDQQHPCLQELLGEMEDAEFEDILDDWFIESLKT